MQKASLNHLLGDVEVMNELRSSHDRVALESAAGGFTDGSESNLDGLLSGAESEIRPERYTQVEAIVLLTGRPPLLIQDGKWQEPSLAVIKERLDRRRSSLLAAIPKVGRVEVINLGDYLGTGWMLEEDVMITNRHVAADFATRVDGIFTFKRDPLGNVYEVRVDFLREHQRSAEWQARIAEIIYLEEASDVRPDLALIRLDAGGGPLPEPIDLDDANPGFNADIAAIGYPAEDGRNDAFAMRKVFSGVYNVKRLSPGRVCGVDFDGKRLIHDCTTLGGSSGSVLINLTSGKACGLHFSGNYRINNYAVSVGWLKARLAEISPRTTVSLATAGSERRPPAPDVTGRKGYTPEFLGAEFPVPLPVVPDPDLIAPVTADAAGELRYTHFSVIMNRVRRLPFFTACNIHGQLLFNFPRGQDHWHLDQRVDARHQIGEELYQRNSLDRGHLVRRLDPAWGESREEAKQAELDTFFFTNCSPQHERLNQHTWLSLEDYILGNAATHDLKVCVFSGPVFSAADREYRGVKLPEEFWKVVCVRNSFTGTLSATAYLLSQKSNLQDLEFVFGSFRTYQVPVQVIESRTGLSFGDLSSYDPMAHAEGTPIRVIQASGDLVL